jgi:hypothetical protein
MRVALALTLGFLVAPAAAFPAAAGAKVSYFRTPSHNIVCIYASSGGPGAYVRCDLLSSNDTAFIVRRHRRGRRIHVTDSANDPRSKTLAYGSSRHLGPFTCTSRTSGLTCRNRRNGHGFFVSRAEQRTF